MDYDEFVSSPWESQVLDALAALNGTATLKEIYRWIEQNSGLTGKDLQATELGGRPKYQHTVRNTISTLVKKDLLAKAGRGTYQIINWEASNNWRMTMTIKNQTPVEIFEDAKLMYSEAIRLLEAGDARDAAEKAWCATKRATDALIMARTGGEPPTTTMTRRKLDELVRQDGTVGVLVGRYHSRLNDLHGDCFYLGAELTETSLRRIRETDQYIADAERLAHGGN